MYRLLSIGGLALARAVKNAVALEVLFRFALMANGIVLVMALAEVFAWPNYLDGK